MRFFIVGLYDPDVDCRSIWKERIVWCTHPKCITLTKEEL